MRRLTLSACAWLAVCTALDRPGVAQDQDAITIEAKKVAGNVYILEGQGGNVAVTVGDDGVFMIDDQFAPLTPKLQAAIAKLSSQPVRFLVNTHWHFDHTGGNENFARSGSIIVAQENVRKRMSTDQFLEAFNQKVPAAPPKALPVVTFREGVTFHWNDDEVRVISVPPAHTDGDSIVHFVSANVIHTGDVYFNGFYPFIDVTAGGSIDGMIAGVDRVLAIANGETRIIPGHGPLSGVAELKAYQAMLKAARDKIKTLVDAGKSRSEVIAAKPTAELDAEWGDGFLKPDDWVGIVYDGMKNRRP